MKKYILSLAAISMIFSGLLLANKSENLNAHSATDYAIMQSECLDVFDVGGWVIKAKNSCPQSLVYSFSYDTVGKDGEGNEVSRESSEYSDLTISGNTTNSIVTAPQDPKKETIYTFENIEIIDVSYE